ncbi:MAG: alpha/beta fold hydrolase [bacterium]|nr:alpha/beta fold hydrolase [bacterium]
MEEKVFILNKKNQKLAAVIHRPQTQGKFPAVILLHGFTGNKEEQHIKQLAIDLARNNFVAIRFDASGYGESEGTTEKDYRLTNYFNDAESVYEYLKNLAYVDKDHIGLFGHSVGAMLTILFAAKHPEVIALAPVSPPYQLETHYRLRGIWKNWKDTGYVEKKERNGRMVKIPYAYLEDAKQYNALDEVSKIKNPILFILGTKDINVIPEETEKLYEKANQPKELFVVDGMDHFYKNFPDKLTIVNKKILEFYKKYL